MATSSPTLKVTPQVAVVLETLMTRSGDHWGFEIIKETGLKSGTLYPILARLETCGWVASGWGDNSTNTSGPRRRYYRLTGIGEQAAIESMARRPTARSADVRGHRFKPAMGRA